MSGQLRLKRPFYDGLRQLLQKTVLSSYVLRRLARRKQLVDQILLLLHMISCLSGMIVYTKLFTPSRRPLVSWRSFRRARTAASRIAVNLCLDQTAPGYSARFPRSEEHTSELQSRQ